MPKYWSSVTLNGGEAKAQRPEPESLEEMRERGGTWAAYQNVELGHAQSGHMKFLRFGDGCTFQTAPKPRLPDTHADINWRYWYVGTVNLATGDIEP